MKKEIADKWIAALRSGNYVQGRSYLRTSDNRFCCLGVLCDILHPTEWIIDDPIARTCYWLHGFDAILPDTVKEEAWMRSNGGDLPLAEQHSFSQTLWQFNDYDKYSFSQIADLIEENWEQL